MQQLKQNRFRVLEHMITFPWDHVKVIFLLRISIVLSFVFLIGSQKLPSSPLCWCPMKSAQRFCSEHGHLEFHGNGSTRSQGVEPVLICDDERISEVPDSSEDALN